MYSRKRDCNSAGVSLETRKQCGNNAERGGIKKHSSNSGLYLQQAKCQNTVLFFHFGLSFQILGGNSPYDTVYRHICNIVHIGVDLLKIQKSQRSFPIGSGYLQLCMLVLCIMKQKNEKRFCMHFKCATNRRKHFEDIALLNQF